MSSFGVMAGPLGSKAFLAFDSISVAPAIVMARLIDGIGAVTLSPPLVLRRNTIVRQYNLRVGAAHGSLTPAGSVAQVRSANPAGAYTVVIDFGTPRTVSSVIVPAGTTVLHVSAWAGAQFAEAFFPANGASGSSNTASFAAEVRTERLLLTLSKAMSAESAGTDITLEIPDLPADLELRINDGPPIWTHPGAVQLSSGVATLSAEHWNQDAQRLVPLADALNALAADPLADAELSYQLVLSSKVPGRLSLAADAAPLYSHIHRVRFGSGSDTSTDLEFSAEGEQFIALELPASSATRHIEALRMTLLAKLPDERILPPLGPDWLPVPDLSPAQPLAELVLDSSHAACVRLDSADLAELSGLRLPLVAGADGAELRVMLWQADPITGEPATALPTGASASITLSGAATPDGWSSVRFDRPVNLEQTPRPWAALVVSRGTVSWSLAGTATVASTGPSLPAPAAGELRHGAPNGPWRQLPALLQGGSAALMAARGRIRCIGLAAKTRPIAPLTLSLLGVPGLEAAVTPTAKGVAVTLNFDAAPALPAGNPSLRIVSRVAGTLTLRDLDLIWTET